MPPPSRCYAQPDALFRYRSIDVHPCCCFAAAVFAAADCRLRAVRHFSLLPYADGHVYQPPLASDRTCYAIRFTALHFAQHAHVHHADDNIRERKVNICAAAQRAPLLTKSRVAGRSARTRCRRRDICRAPPPTPSPFTHEAVVSVYACWFATTCHTHHEFAITARAAR